MTSSPTAESAAALREAADGFFLAAEHGRSDVIKALADHNDGRIDLSQIVDAATGRSPLHVAVAHHKTDALRVLLAAGFPPDVGSAQANGKTRTAYALAVETQAHDLVFVFHQFAVQQVAMDNAQGVAQLLAAGVPLRVTDSATTGNTLLHWAVTCRALAVCELLLERDEASALVNHTNAEGATPLHIACRDGKLDFVRLLLTHGADPRCSGTGGFCKDKTPAELVTSTEIRELLARHEERLLEAQAKAERGTSDADTAGEALDSSASLTEADAIAMARRKHSQQLEEKDLLIRQLKSTIETLVVEAQEIRKLGEERTVLDYIRKLREEKDIVRRQLEDAEDHIRIQQQQIQELKRQIRSMEAQPPPPPRPPLPPPQRPSPATDTAAEPAEKSPLSDTAPAPAASPAEEAPAEAPAVAPTDSIGRVTERNRSLPPLRIDTTPPRSRRSTPPRSASGTWSDVWSVLVGNGLQADDVDADGEVIMTV